MGLCDLPDPHDVVVILALLELWVSGLGIRGKGAEKRKYEREGAAFSRNEHIRGRGKKLDPRT